MVSRRTLDTALEPSLGAGPVPTRGPELVRYAGGRRALTQQLSGMAGPPKRGDYRDPEAYRAASTRWRSASRQAQRWDDAGRPGKQTRGRAKGARLEPAEKARLRRAANVRKREQLVRRGMRARLKAVVLVPSPGARGGDERTRTLPPSGPGVFIDGSSVEAVLDEVGEDREAAAAAFLEVFLESYGMPIETEIPRLVWLKTWPEGTPEPRDVGP